MSTLLPIVIPWSFLPVPLWVQVLAVVAWVGLITLLAEELSRRNLADSEMVRKIVHIGTGNVILFAWWFHSPAWLGIGASVIFGVVTLLSYKLPLLPGINSVGRKSLGTFFYAVSIGVLIALFWQADPRYAALGILTMTWGDGLAALIGQKYGKHRYQLWDIHKSWEGSLTMTLATFVISIAVLSATQEFSWNMLLVSLLVAIAATVLETFSKLGIDNLTVPLGSAAIAYALNGLLLA